MHVPDGRPALRRRTFLGAAAAAGLGVAGARAAPAAAVVEQRERAVVVGSGFGGGVTALRLARAGVRTLVLERGIRWPTGPNADTFPHFPDADRRASWLSPVPVVPLGLPGVFAPFTGMIEKVPGTGMTIYCAAAVGGGSLAYHGMTLQPTEANFARSMPAAAADYAELSAVHYPAVARMLRVGSIPADVLAAENYRSSRLFLDVMRDIGLEPFRAPLPVDWASSVASCAARCGRRTPTATSCSASTTAASTPSTSRTWRPPRRPAGSASRRCMSCATSRSTRAGAGCCTWTASTPAARCRSAGGSSRTPSSSPRARPAARGSW